MKKKKTFFHEISFMKNDLNTSTLNILILYYTQTKLIQIDMVSKSIVASDSPHQRIPQAVIKRARARDRKQ